MNIIRAPKEENLKDYFNGLINSGLVGYPSSGYNRWHWKYVENPFCLGQDPPSWAYNLDAKAVGHLGAIPVELNVDSLKVPAGWAIDFMASSAHRRMGIGRALVEEANKRYDLFLAVGATDASFALFTKMGWEFLGFLPYYIKIFDLKTVIRNRIRNVFIANCLSVIINFFLKAYNYFKRPKIFNSIAIERIDNFNEEADLLWEEISGYYKAIVTRNKAYLSWRYDKQRDMQYVKFRAAVGGKLRGYIVVRCSKPQPSGTEGLIADIIARGDDRDVISALTCKALSYLKDQGCSIVRCYASHKDIQSALISCGLIKSKSQMRLLVKKNIRISKDIDNLDNWHITAGDSDIDR